MKYYNFLIGIHDYFIRPLIKGKTLLCNIVRKNHGLDKVYPKYHLQIYNNNKFLIAAKKHITNNYTLSINEENFEDSNIIGKLSSNLVGTIFNIYNNGKHPKEAKNQNEIRQQYGCVTYVM